MDIGRAVWGRAHFALRLALVPVQVGFLPGPESTFAAAWKEAFATEKDRK
jgi:hypothetical protein